MSVNQQTSALIDFARFGAAVAVLLSHALPIFFPAWKHDIPGHHAVILFFILSGFVIGHVSSRPRASLVGYAIDRSTRLLSVGIPALLFSYVVFFAVRPELLGHPQGGQLGDFHLTWEAATYQMLMNAIFLAQSGESPLRAPLNGPYWSLNYEFWYYAIFGAWYFISSRLGRILVVSVMCLVAGFKVCILLPCWWAGVWIYHQSAKPLPEWLRSKWLVAGMVGAYLLFYYSGISHRTVHWLESAVPQFMEGLGASHTFLTDYLLALIFAGLLRILPAQIPRRLHPSVERAANWLGGLTFSLYAFHNVMLAIGFSIFLWLGGGALVKITILLGVLMLSVPLTWATDSLRRSLRRRLSSPVESPRHQ